MKCTTRSGLFRCSKTVDAKGKHDGECECAASEASMTTIAREAVVTEGTRRAYLLGLFDGKRGLSLDAAGEALGCRRRMHETDKAYFRRLSESLA